MIWGVEVVMERRKKAMEVGLLGGNVGGGMVWLRRRVLGGRRG